MKVIKTNAAKNIFWEETSVESKEVGSMNLVKLYPECQRQTMQGFGGAFTEAAGYVYSKFSQESKEEFLDAYFSESGLNYNIGRTHMNSCDFSLSNYAAVTEEGDKEFQTFTFEREDEYLFPLITDAYRKRGEAIGLLLSPWSPPAFMKSNGEMNNGGMLKKEHYATWARYTTKYIRELRNRGFEISYLSVQNEPEATQTWDSCRYTAKQEAEYVRDYLGKELKENGLEDIKIIVWDHNKEMAYERAQEIYGDEESASYIYGMGVHWYTGDHFEALSLVKEAYPEKEIFFTEGCVEYSRFADSDDTVKAEMYAHDMMGNFNHGISAFYDWNLLLDAKGGPNHVGNFCAAPIMAAEDEQSFKKQLSYYYIGHFSKYVKAGAKVIATSRYSDQVEVCAFLNPDGEKVVVLMNKTDKDCQVTVEEGQEGIDMTLDPHTIITLLKK